MHKINFFPLGNADCCRIDLECGKKILFDYADTQDIDDPEDLRWDLSNELQEDLKKCDRKYYDVVAFTHLDKDHLKGSSKFFYAKAIFEHPKFNDEFYNMNCYALNLHKFVYPGESVLYRWYDRDEYKKIKDDGGVIIDVVSKHRILFGLIQ